MKIKSFIIGILTLPLVSCSYRSDNSRVLQNRIDSLERKLMDTYKPGFGEFMSGIQMHHSKLWFAGQNQNWNLADFEIHEIIESIEAIQKYQGERKESQVIGMILPALDSVTRAIQQKDETSFTKSYILLTNTCNKCHQAVDFGFNVVKIPDSPPVGNQEFKLKK